MLYNHHAVQLNSCDETESDVDLVSHIHCYYSFVALQIISQAIIINLYQSFFVFFVNFDRS